MRGQETSRQVLHNYAQHLNELTASVILCAQIISEGPSIDQGMRQARFEVSVLLQRTPPFQYISKAEKFTCARVVTLIDIVPIRPAKFSAERHLIAVPSITVQICWPPSLYTQPSLLLPLADGRNTVTAMSNW